MKPHMLSKRETAQVIAALRYWGRAMELGSEPHKHPMVRSRFHLVDSEQRVVGDISPMTLDEIETLIGRLDETWVERGLRKWDGFLYL